MRIQRLPVISAFQLLGGGILSLLIAGLIYFQYLDGPTAIEPSSLQKLFLVTIVAMSFGLLGTLIVLWALFHLVWALFRELASRPQMTKRLLRPGRIE